MVSGMMVAVVDVDIAGCLLWEQRTVVRIKRSVS